MAQSPKLLRNLSIIGSSTMLSRLLGFVRDLLTAVWLGTGPMADAFIIAQRLPNLLRGALAEGGINSVFVPGYNRQLHHNEGQATAYAAQILSWLLTILVPIIVLAMVFMEEIISTIAPGVVDTAEVFHRAVNYSEVTVFYLIVICITAVQGAILSAHNSFGPYAGSPAILNAALILTMFAAHLLGEDIGMTGSWALLVGGTIQILYLYRTMAKKGVRLGLAKPRATAEVRSFFKHLLPGTLGMSVMNVNILVGTYFASWLPTGAIASLYYADRLNQLPIALIGASLGTLLLPTLTRTMLANDMVGAKRALDQAVITGLLLSLPVTLGMIVLGEPLIRLLLQHGSFTAEDTVNTASALACYALMLPGAVLGRILQCCSYAKHDTKSPAFAAVFSMVVNVIAAAILVETYGHVGIALAITIATWGNTLAQAILLYRRDELPLGPALFKQTALLLVGCGIMYGIMYVLQPLLPMSGEIVHAIMHLVVIGGCGLLGYGLFVLCFQKAIMQKQGPHQQGANEQ